MKPYCVLDLGYLVASLTSMFTFEVASVKFLFPKTEDLQGTCMKKLFCTQ